ncbi:MAG TPA: hypothetical protein DIW31_04650 [Bacteroidales bacterium]|nr:hypothetical protein [Bacteroidales bacterium]
MRNPYRFLIVLLFAFIFSLKFQYANAQVNSVTIEGSSTFCWDGGPEVYTIHLNWETEPAPSVTSIVWSLDSYDGRPYFDEEQGLEYMIVNPSDTQSDFTITVTVTLSNGQVLTNSKEVTGDGVLSVNSITGSNIVYRGAQLNYYATPVPGSTGYIWSVPSGATISNGQNTNTILVNFSQTAVSGNISVSVQNKCGSGNPSKLFVTVNPQLTIGPISGNSNICAGTKGVVYSVPIVYGVTNYTWTVPYGAYIASGTGSNSITVNYNSSAVSGNISVSGGNAQPAYLPVTISTQTSAGIITGLNAVNPGANGITYSISSVTGASEYNWEVPNGATITSNSKSNNIVVNYSSTATSGIIKVTPISGCGGGVPSHKLVTVGDISTTGSLSINPINANNNYLMFKTNGTNLGIIGSGASINSGVSSNLGMAVYGNNNLEFSTNSTKRLIINGSGYIGIGTLNPNSKLEINHGTAGNSGLRFTQLNSMSPTTIGNGKFLSVNSTGDVILTDAGSLTSAWSFLGNAGTNPTINFIGTTDNKDLIIRTNNTEKVRVTSNGNVGIGTTSPATKLEVLSGLSNNEIARFGGTVSERGLILSSFVVGGTNEVGFNFNAPGAGGAAAISFSTLSTERMIINYDGKVGIGTTTANNKLEINHGTVGNSGLRFTQLNSSSTAVAGNGKFLSVNSTGDVILTDAGNSTSTWNIRGNTGTNPTNNFIGTTDNQDFVIRTNNYERIRVTSDGSIGIGTIPQHRLHVAGDVFFSTGENSETFVIQNGPSGYNALRYDGDNNLLLLQENAGNVGIGTTDTKGFKLAVAGRVIAEEVIIRLQPWPDFIFNSNHKLRSLSELEQFIKTNKHLPEIPTEKEAQEQGIGVGEMNAKLLQKIEELTLYIIDQNKRIEALENEVKNLNSK